ncbi:MAG: VanZ family protein [Bacilli bacterium]
MKKQPLKKTVYQIILIILYLFLIGFFCYSCLQDGNESGEESQLVAQIILRPIELITGSKIEITDEINHLIRKLVGHYGYFVVLGTVSSLLYYSFDRPRLSIRILINFVSGLLFALFSEFVLQSLTPGRGPSIQDAGIDYAGFVTLSLVITIIYLVKQKKKSLPPIENQ